jgi:hypothetical protein
MDVVGLLPAPPTKANRGASDVLEGQLFAYAVGAAITVIDVSASYQELHCNGLTLLWSFMAHVLYSEVTSMHLHCRFSICKLPVPCKEVTAMPLSRRSSGRYLHLHSNVLLERLFKSCKLYLTMY